MDNKLQQNNQFSPVIAVVGHVDHGKTSLLDAIRNTSVASGEHGGITQKIGASQVEVDHEGKKRFITLIDTPGHAAFSSMRGRGARAADIGLLVVSLADGVKPQTKESIELLKNAQIPYIVVFTKADLPNTIPEKVKQELLRENVMLEGYGGSIPYIEVSSVSGKNIKELLELILLSFDMIDNTRSDLNSSASLEAIIIESKLDPKTGSKATIIIKNGTISLRDEIICEGVLGKVKSLQNDKGVSKQSATIGEAVEVLGFEKVPPVGGVVYKKGQEKKQEQKVTTNVPQISQNLTPEQLFMDEKTNSLSLILCADTQGSLEAITQSLSPEIVIVLEKTGDISEADVLLAKSTGAILLGFNIRLRPEVVRLAQTEKILMKTYRVIYELIDEVHDVMEGKRLQGIDEELGKAKILATFPFEKQTVLGIKVLEGRIAKGDKMKLIHENDHIGDATIASLRQGKQPLSKVEVGAEAGIIITPQLDITIGDMVISYR